MTPLASQRQAGASPEQDAADGRVLPRTLSKERFETIARIAALILRPLDYLDDAHCVIPPLDSGAVRAMAMRPSFQSPINGEIAEATGLARLKFDDGIIGRLLSLPQSRLAALITTAPMSEIGLIADMIAASALWRRINQFLLKLDRERAREILGPDGFRIATQEAPILNPILGDLGWRSASSEIFRAGAETPNCQKALRVFGLDLVCAFLEAVEPLLSDIFALRLAGDVTLKEPGASVSPLEESYCVQIVRLIRRRRPAWSHIIG